MTAKSKLTEAISNGVRSALKGVNTAIPGHVLNFDPDTQLSELQVAIERIDADGNSDKWSPIIFCPVHFAGGKFVLEHQIDVGDEGLIIFSQRCIDAWLDQGGVAPQSRVHFHNANDAMFIPGVRSQPKKIQNFENDGIKLRNEDGSKFIHLKSDGTAEMTITTLKINGNIEHTGNNTQTGNLVQTGSISSTVSVSAPSMSAATSLTVAGKEMDGHKHSAGTYNIGGTPVVGTSGEPA